VIVYQDLLAIDLKKIIRKVVDRISKEMPSLIIHERVLEVSIDPDLDLLYIRFDKDKEAALGEYIGEYIHVFSDGGRVIAVEITPFSKFMRELKA